MTWGTVTVGGIAFREELSVAQAAGGTLRMVGQESSPPSSVAHVMAAHHNVIGLNGSTVPVVFSDKAELSGFYRVTDAASELFRFANGAVQSATWSMQLERVGSSRDVEIESRVPTIPRLDELPGTQTPSYWHAPAVGFTSYWTGSTVPAGSVARVSTEGTVTAFTGLPTGVAPRWTVAAADYLDGSSRILLDGIRRAGTFTPPHTSWEINNGLVRVQGAASGTVNVSSWSAGAWASVQNITFAAPTPLAGQPDVTVLLNGPESVTVRLTYPTSPGRVTVDLSLRRGGRFIAGVLKRHSASSLGVTRTSGVAMSAATGGIVQTTADASGNRLAIGTSRVHTSSTSTVATSGATLLDFFVGHEVGGTPATGDAFADLLAQYLGSSGERTRIVRR